MNLFRWRFADCNSALAMNIASLLGTPQLLAQCLVNRGCATPDAAARFLEPRLAHLRDPFILPSMDRAVDRLLQAHRNRERFIIFGDYDVDGVTSTALLTEFFRALGWESVYYLPHRFEEGYGLSQEAVENCLARFPAQLLLAVDCGSSATEVIRGLANRGVDVIVLDHHQPTPPHPPALALVNPHLGSDPDAKKLCSAGLAFKLAHALLKRCRELRWPEAMNFDLRQFLDFVALGTIADIVPLRDENRIFARTGLEKLRATARPGLVALKKVASINGSLQCSEVGFQLGPRLNAAGRLETALDALELLLTPDTTRAQQLAAALDEQNRTRQTLEKKIADEALAAVRARFDPSTDFAIVEGNNEWHLGVVGIVASRILREFHRPVVILGGDGSGTWRGSGRSIEGFDLAEGLRLCGDILLKCGGHAMAAGVTMLSDRISDFRTRLNELARSALSADALQRALEIDGEISLSDLNFQSVQALSRIEPTGHGNPPVQFVAHNLQLRSAPKPFGAAQQHRRFVVSDGRASHQAVWWNFPSATVLPTVFDLAFSPELNEFNGTFGIQLRVLDVKSV